MFTKMVYEYKHNIRVHYNTFNPRFTDVRIVNGIL